MNKPNYYTLLIKQNKSNKWRIEFGDFDRETVEEERDITWREGLGCTLKDTKIIKTSESQKEIDAEVKRLNDKALILPPQDVISDEIAKAKAKAIKQVNPSIPLVGELIKKLQRCNPNLPVYGCVDGDIYGIEVDEYISDRVDINVAIPNANDKIEEIRDENEVLARENKAFAEYLERSGFSNDAITSIAFGSDEPELQCQSCEELDYSKLEKAKKDKTEILNKLVAEYGVEYGLDKENLGSYELHSSDENVAYDIGYLEGITRILKIVTES